MTHTERKYLIAAVFGVAAIIGWNIFCIQRDDMMFKAYYRQQAIQRLKTRPNTKIIDDLTPSERFCQQQAGWHPDCTAGPL